MNGQLIPNEKANEDYLGNGRYRFKENGLWGVKDSLGQIIRAPSCERIAYKKSTRLDVIDYHNCDKKEMSLAPVLGSYDHVEEIRNKNKKYLRKVTIGKKVGLINMQGEEVLSVIYDEINKQSL